MPDINGCIDGKVSIHAPIKGATAIKDAYLSPKAVSIHAPIKGATPL